MRSQPPVTMATADPQSYLRQAEVDGRRLRDVHNFTVRRHDKHEAVQSLKDRHGFLNMSLLDLQHDTHFLFGMLH